MRVNIDFHWVYWGIATVLLAAVVHLAIVLFLPTMKTARHIASFDVTGEIARLEQISARESGDTLLSRRSPDIAYAFCRFDLSERPLKISARFPKTFWTIGVFSDIGDNVYSLNDRQAGVNELEILLLDGSSGTDQSTEGVNAGADTIVVSSLAQSGVVVFRALVENPSEQEAVEQTLAASVCEMG